MNEEKINNSKKEEKEVEQDYHLENLPAEEGEEIADNTHFQFEELTDQLGIGEEKIVEVKSKVWYIKTLLDLFFVLIMNVIAFRVALKFLGIEVTNSFANLLYSITEPLVKPFLNLFPQLLLVSNSSILEGGSIIALIFFFLFGKLFIKLIHSIETK